MREDEQVHLAGILAECAQRLDDGLARLARESSSAAADVGDDDASGEVARALGVIAKRIHDVRQELLDDLARGRRRSAETLLRQWTSPRLGVLRHHLPEPLRVPSHYLRTAPPVNPPPISIVTPSYEQGRYLERTIYSVLSQNYPRLQYVVQDGGSSDETRDVLAHFGDSLSHWVCETDDGQADAINRGFARTDGEIMAYLNSDDLLLPGSLAYVAGYFQAHPDVDAVYGHRVMIDENDQRIGSWVLPRHDAETLTVNDYVPQETLFWRRELWERAGARIDTSFSFAIDWDLLLRFREAGARMVRLPRFLGAFRVHAEQKTAREQDLCDTESQLLRLRAHGRALSAEEILARCEPYLRWHVLHHTIHRLKERLPLPRSNVRTVPRDTAVERAVVTRFDLR
jgi:Glycosyl transferase family 2